MPCYHWMGLHDRVEGFPADCECSKSFARGDGHAVDCLDKHSKLADQRSGPQIFDKRLALLLLLAASLAGHDEEGNLTLFALRNDILAGLEETLAAYARDRLKLSILQSREER